MHIRLSTGSFTQGLGVTLRQAQGKQPMPTHTDADSLARYALLVHRPPGSLRHHSIAHCKSCTCAGPVEAMSALGACTRKLVHLCFGIFKHQVVYSPKTA